MLTDTHCHLDLNKYDVDREQVLERAQKSGVTRILIPGITLQSSLSTVKLAESHPSLFAAIGVHPTDALTWDGESLPGLGELAKNSKVVAVGEIGLDYYWDAAPHDLQKQTLIKQLELAAELKKPVIVHMREKGDTPHGPCAEELLDILAEWHTNLRVTGNPLSQNPGVLHSFSGNLETANKAISLNFYIGITGPVTYKNAEVKRHLVANLPLEKLLIETDAPYLSPVPYRGQRNEPAFVSYIADKIAELHHKDREEVAAITYANAAQLFTWGE